ncbi:cytochrome P450 [Mycena amicta]|nr:cytochrome P450 [Mycena amicta]
MTPVRQLHFTDVLVLVGGVWLAAKIVKRLATRRTTQGTRLNGPPRQHLLFGVSHQLSGAVEPAEVFEEWAATYGPVFEIPTAFWGKRIVLTDPRAVNHFYASERSVYVKTQMNRNIIGNIFGHGLLWAEGEDHKRQRKALTPAFSNAAIRRLTEVFYDSAHKLKGYWDHTLENASEGAIIDVGVWMNRVALDSIGISGFGHDFRSLHGEPSAAAEAFDSMALQGGRASAINFAVFMIGQQIPLLAELPTSRNLLFKNLRKSLSAIADVLLENARQEKQDELVDDVADKSIIGLLLKAEHEDAELHMDKAEIVAQMNVLLLAGKLQHQSPIFHLNTFLEGYETTSITLTWALIQLCRHPEKQAKLRDELHKFGAQDPTWDQLGSSLPYLDAVVLEILRLHPAVPDTARRAQVDDVIPVGEPITTKAGVVVNQIAVPKDSVVTVSIRCMNRSTALWGPDAGEFNPERWLTIDEDSFRAKEIQGHRHLTTFVDGPRTCLGKQFALAEFKAVLLVLIKNYTFELPDGPQTKITDVLGLLRRPAIVGQEVPLRIQRVD